MTKQLIQGAHSILTRAVQMWEWQAPDPKSELYTCIHDLLRATKKTEIMEAVFTFLKNNYPDRNFPTFFHWKNAIKEITFIDFNLSPKMTLVDIGERKIRLYEKEAVELLKSWSDKPEVQKAKTEGWYGRVWDNFAVMPGGLAAYLYAIILKQMKILNLEIDCALNEPRELIKTDYLKWVRSSSFSENVLMHKEPIFLYRSEDLEKIRNNYLNTKKLIITPLNLTTIFKSI
ncbi:MAG: hypothetical protein ULS35scaffold63_63 [Phage 33_17]|nr:MAG: hypothetical protein ULS35scaffold63_63 [Phage 33_17]